MDPVSPQFSNSELGLESLPDFREVKLYSLDPKYLVKRHIGTTISLLFFSAALLTAFIIFVDFRPFVLAAAGFFFLLFGWSYYTNVQLLKRNGYGIREKDIIYKHGFLSETTTVVPFNRIQHISVERSFLDKMLGLSTLKVFTAGGSGSDVSIPGLKPEISTSLKEEVSERISNHA